jgi:CshA-type fibril repeat protein
VLPPAAPIVDSNEQTIVYNTATDVTPNVVGYKLQPTQACIVSGLHCYRTFTVSGAGTFTVLADGTLIFTPLDTFAGGSVTVTYRAYDLWGQNDQNTVKVNVSLPDAPSVDPSEVTVDYNHVANVTPTVYGAYIQVGEACLVDGDNCVKRLVVDGKGTFNVLDDGSVSFTPLDTFAGDSVTATYRATDFKGQTGENTA